MRKGGVLFEFFFDLTKNALFILGERHESIIAREAAKLNAVTKSSQEIFHNCDRDRLSSSSRAARGEQTPAASFPEIAVPTNVLPATDTTTSAASTPAPPPMQELPETGTQTWVAF